MSELRALIAVRPWFALLLAFLVLAARLVTPAGFMPMGGSAGAALVPCSGMGPMAMPGGHDRHSGKAPAPPTHQPCGFGALADVATGGADATLLVAALAFVMAAARLPAIVPVHRRATRLRPPLRAPPA